jgi:hypothetical protein
MNLLEVRRLVERALTTKQARICAHIEKVQCDGHRSGIESEFARAFEQELSGTTINRPKLCAIETTSYYPGRRGGTLDCHIPGDGTTPGRGTALEYKAVRLPRNYSDSVGGALYDMGQLTSDFLRLARAKRLEFGYVIAFLYGPLVRDTGSPGKLYRAFHNQMFVDFSVSNDQKDQAFTPDRRWACRRLGWNSARGGSKVPDGVKAIQHGSLGAVCIDCRA